MKKIAGLFIVFVTLSCSKKSTVENGFSNESSAPKYDTLAIDSFSTGATSVDVARKIRISSQKYQDSLRNLKVELEKEKLLKKDAEEKSKAEKLLDDAKKKAEDLKKEKKKSEVQNSPEQNPITP